MYFSNLWDFSQYFKLLLLRSWSLMTCTQKCGFGLPFLFFFKKKNTQQAYFLVNMIKTVINLWWTLTLYRFIQSHAAVGKEVSIYFFPSYNFFSGHFTQICWHRGNEQTRVQEAPLLRQRRQRWGADITRKQAEFKTPDAAIVCTFIENL